MERTKRAISEIYVELKERAKEAGLNISVKKATEVVPNRKTRRRRRSEKLAVMIMTLKLL
jgi:hypothetical protein